MGILICLVLIIAIGHSIYVCILNKSEKSMFIGFGLSLGIGCAAVAQQMLLYNFLGINWSFASIYLPWFILFYFIYSNPEYLKLKINYKRLTKVEKILIAFIIAVVSYAFLETILRPVSAWDAIASWFLGGKAFFVDQKILPSYYIYANYDYPPFMHLILAAVNLLEKDFNDSTSLLLYFLFFPSMLVVFYTLLRKSLSRNISMLFVFLLASTQNVVRHAGKYDIGNADLPLSYFFLISLFFILRFKKTKYTVHLIFAVVFLISSALIKNDGIPYAISGLAILLYLVIRNSKNKKIHLFMLSILPLPFLYWRYFSALNDLPSTYINFYNFHLDRFQAITISFFKEFINLRRWNLVWVFVGLALFLNRNVIKYPVVLILLTSQFISYIYVYFVTPIEVTSHIQNSFDRLLLQILPISLYFAVILLFAKSKGSEGN